MRSNVRYSQDHREMAKRDRLRLATVAITHPGGKPFIVMQMIDQESIAKVEKFLLKLMKEIK